MAILSPGGDSSWCSTVYLDVPYMVRQSEVVSLAVSLPVHWLITLSIDNGFLNGGLYDIKSRHVLVNKIKSSSP